MGTAEACLLQKHEVISHKQLVAQEHVCFQNQTLPLKKKKKLLVLINKFSKVQDIRSIQKYSVVFLHTSKELSEKKMKKKVPLMIISKRRK